jgi:tetratricopeptide (TPR) repeat protein
LGNLALIYYRMRQPQRALQHFQQALVCAQNEGDKLTESGLLGNIGNILRELGRHEDAIIHLQQALQIALETGDLRGRGIWLGNLGLVYDDLQQPHRAIELHTQAVIIARQFQDLRGLSSRLANLGNSHVSAGDYLSAIHHFEEAVKLHEQLGDQRELALRLGIIGNLYAELGRTAVDLNAADQYFDHALRYYQRTLTMARVAGDAVSEAHLLRSIGNALANSAQYNAAIEQYRAAYRLFEQLGMSEPLVDLRNNIDLATQYRDTTRPS